MANNSNEKKRALVIFMLLFLATGGGLFLYMVIQGANDITGGGKGSFSYGNAAREAVTSFFKVVGIAEKDPIMEYGPGKRPLPKSVLEAKLAKKEAAEAAAADANLESWGGVKGRSAAPTSVPKMGGGGLSGAGALGGGGGSKSAGSVARFGGGSGSGNTRISNSGPSATGTTEKGTLASLQNAKAALGEGLRSGSAMTAKGKWGTAFGEGSGKGGQLAYASGGMVKLDTIKKGEVMSLKASYKKSPDIPEAGAFKQDKGAEAKDAGLQKAKKDAEDSIKKAAAEAAANAAAQAAAQGAGGTATQPTGRSDRPATDTGGQSQGSCDANMMGPQTQVCSQALNMAFPDETVSFQKLGSSSEGTLYSVKFDATDPPATQGSNMLVRPDGTVDWTFGEYKNK